MAQRKSTHPLYDTTFSLHRLNIELSLDSSLLRQHAQRFRDILAGDVLRGVRVNSGVENRVLAGAGALQNVTWTLLLEEEVRSEGMTELGDDSTVTLAASRGVVVEVVYEQAVYTALLLRDDRGSADESVLTTREDLDGPQRFPLLMTRMTPPLREAFIGYLTETFDVRVAPLWLERGFLVDAMENFMSDVSIGENDETMDFSERSRALRRTFWDVVITIGFDTPGGQLKAVEINVAKEDLATMVVQGERLGREDVGRSPFFDALVKYVKTHLALDLRHELVKIKKITCHAFSIGAGDGKIKITQPAGLDGGNAHSRAARRLVHGLIDAATNGPLAEKMI